MRTAEEEAVQKTEGRARSLQNLKPHDNFSNATREEQAERGRRGALALKRKKEISEIVTKGNAYLEECLKAERPATQSGLARTFGFKTREDFLEASKNGASYLSDTYQEFLLKIEEFLEIQLLTSKNPSGAIFALKNRGWKDTQEVKTENKNVTLTVDSSIQDVLKELDKK